MSLNNSQCDVSISTLPIYSFHSKVLDSRISFSAYPGNTQISSLTYGIQVEFLDGFFPKTLLNCDIKCSADKLSSSVRVVELEHIFFNFSLVATIASSAVASGEIKDLFELLFLRYANEFLHF